jgi:membrane-bound ClpP family serine protease
MGGAIVIVVETLTESSLASFAELIGVIAIVVVVVVETSCTESSVVTLMFTTATASVIVDFLFLRYIMIRRITQKKQSSTRREYGSFDTSWCKVACIFDVLLGLLDHRQIATNQRSSPTTFDHSH